MKEIAKIADKEFEKFLIKCMEQGVEVGAFPKDFDIKLNAQILYAVVIGIDSAILYDLPINTTDVWRELVLKLFK